jgi:putative MATE family efflux protein
MKPASNVRTALLQGPIAATLLRLAWPVLVVLALQTLVGIAETWFVSFLGTAAVAGVTLVFPLFMLMAMMSNGGIGGGVSSAVARAMGAGRASDARALALHALVVAVVFGGAFSLAAWLGGRALFAAMGGTGDTLENALVYSNVLFASAIPAWIANLLAAALRGAGNVRVPALVTAVGAFATLALSPLFIFGWGVIPGLGVAGAGLAFGTFNVASAIVLALYMRSARSPLRLEGGPLERRHFREILGVGLPSAAGTVVANLTVVVTTGFVGTFGGAAIAGYGLASRLDYLLIPLLFALGTACVTMVGTNMGAGQYERARRIRMDVRLDLCWCGWSDRLCSRCAGDSMDGAFQPGTRRRACGGLLPRASRAGVCVFRRRHGALFREPRRGKNGLALRGWNRAAGHRRRRRVVLDESTGGIRRGAVLDRHGQLRNLRRDQPLRHGKRAGLGQGAARPGVRTAQA